MESNKVNYIPMTSETVIAQGDYQQLRVCVFAVDGERINSFVSIALWARYLTRTDKDLGLKRDEAPFRPAGKSITVPLVDAEYLAEAIVDLKEEFLRNG